MTSHSNIKKLLYDYLTDDLSVPDRTIVDEHLAACSACRHEADALRDIITVTSNLPRPSEQRQPEYWQQFALGVEQKIRRQAEAQASFLDRVLDELVSFVTFHKAPLATAAGGLVMLSVAILLWKSQPVQQRAESVTQEQSQPVMAAQTAPPDVMQASDRMGDYFRRSRMLLVGITNMNVNEDQPVDLSTEKKVSRDLVHEARYLKQQPMDERSARLVGDMEKILIELANLKERGAAPNIDIIRSGIHQENLLFKIRMAEALYDTSRFQLAGFTNQGK